MSCAAEKACSEVQSVIDVPSEAEKAEVNGAAPMCIILAQRLAERGRKAGRKRARLLVGGSRGWPDEVQQQQLLGIHTSFHA